jgi:hypothetical protein
MPFKKGTNSKTSATGETDTDTKNLHQVSSSLDKFEYVFIMNEFI